MRFLKRKRKTQAEDLRYIFRMTIIPSTYEPEELEEVEPVRECVLFDRPFASHEQACEAALAAFKQEVATSVFLAEFRLYKVLPDGQLVPATLLNPQHQPRALLFTYDMYVSP
ncbi:hypothetical protein KBC99_00275 [Candidatus Saccharibacteria bacterium]|nr:hypothetical protein [Candidatus Saccharibacteria bacterium]